MKKRFDDFDPEDLHGQDSKRLGLQGRRLLKLNRAETFRCQHCGADVPLMVWGSENRNHCPLCLWSRHVDEAIGDRRATCLASMEPVGLTLKKGGGELMVIHRCCGCDKLNKNRLGGDDNEVIVLNLLEKSLEGPDFWGEVAVCKDVGIVSELLRGR